MGIPTVLMIGTEHLSSVPEYLRLRSVVVIAPTRSTLTRWQREQATAVPGAAPATPQDELAVDLAGRRLMWRGVPLPLTDLEFRVAACLAAEPGRAWGYRELRRMGWGDGSEYGIDVFAVRSVIQRIRRKLAVAEVAGRIESVRGYGFRLEPRGAP